MAFRTEIVPLHEKGGEFVVLSSQNSSFVLVDTSHYLNVFSYMGVLIQTSIKHFRKHSTNTASKSGKNRTLPPT